MSEPMSPIQMHKFESEIKHGSQSPNLSKRFYENKNIVLTICVNNRFLRELQDAKYDFPQFTYVQIFNTQLSYYNLLECERIENRLRVKCSEIENISRKKDGRKKMEFLNQTYKLAVFDQELRNVTELDFELSKFKRENVQLQTEVNDLLLEIQNLKTRNIKLQEDNKSFSTEMDRLKTENHNMFKYVTELEDRCVVPNSKITCFDSLHGKIRNKCIRELKTKSEKALWFAESYGLIPKALSFDTNSGKTVKLDFSTNCSTNYEIFLELL